MSVDRSLFLRRRVNELGVKRISLLLVRHLRLSLHHLRLVLLSVHRLARQLLVHWHCHDSRSHSGLHISLVLSEKGRLSVTVVLVFFQVDGDVLASDPAHTSINCEYNPEEEFSKDEAD